MPCTSRAVSFSIPMMAMAAAISCVSGTANADCTPGWQPATAASNVGASIRWLTMWDPDGAGPAAPVLVASGDFNAAAPAGTSSATNVAVWNGSNWSDLGGGLDGPGYSLTSTSADNNLFVCGASFANAGGNSARRVARWDGTAWNGMDTGTGNTPSLALLSATALNANTIVVTGAFTSVSSTSGTNRVAAWNAVDGWTALGSGMSSTTSACITMPNGDLIVGGAALTTGDGSLTVNRVARWDGTQWSALGSGLDGLVRCFAVMPNGDLIAGGAFTATGDGATPLDHIARWDGSTWSALGAGIGGTGVLSTAAPYAMAVASNGDLIVAGDFTTAGGNTANRIARWNGSTWSTYGAGLNAPARALAIMPDGDIAVGGDFTTVDGLPANRFAIYSNSGPASISDQSSSMDICVTDTATFFVNASGGAPLTYQWQQQDLFNLPDFIDINDGPVLDGFGNELCEASGTNSPTLTLTNHQGVAQIYRCHIYSPCGSIDSNEMTLTYNGCSSGCAADLDDGTGTGNRDGGVDINDLLFFLVQFEAGTEAADLDDGSGTGTTDGGVDINDLLFFLVHFEAGC